MVDTVRVAFAAALTSFFVFIPKLIGALLVLLVGFFVGRAIAALVTKLLRMMRFDQIADRAQIDDFLRNAGVTLDMSRHFYDPSYGSKLYATQYNLGIAYTANACTTVKVAYNSTLSVPLSTTPGVPAAPATRDQSLLFEIDLRTLGDVKASAGVR